uniref:uncharacterized protein LOC120326684 isoform X1 n=1 Tax=Styela clava TaxID=7725 RepID=UPI001939D2B2|nr:uncharacterized protein LOC120326684 isoform X1 [Styela clava]
MAHSKHNLTIFDWNILAPMWINIEEYMQRDGDLNLLHKDKRLLLVIDRIIQYDADIITLQEVQEDQYIDICEELFHKYHSLGHTQHDKNYWTEWLADDCTVMRNGQATFVRKGLFNVLDKHEFGTSEDGNVCQIVTLQFSHCESHDGIFILVNCHLESGMIDWKHKTRAGQVLKIHGEIVAMMKKYGKEDSPTVIFLGDFNTFGNQLGMREMRKQGYIDIEKMMCNTIRPTFIIVVTEDGQEEGIQLDHIFLLKSQVYSGKISVKKFEVPNVASTEYDNGNHKSTILSAFSRRLERKNITQETALLDSRQSDLLNHVSPSRDDFKETNPLRALRIGSDHLPLFVELDMQSCK